MPEGFSWTISGATIIAMLGWMSTVLIMAFRRGAAEQATSASIAQLRKDHDALVGDVRKERENDRREFDAFQVAVNAGIQVVAERHGEHRAEVAKTYATKQEMLALEERTNKGMDRIVDRLEQISGRLETIGDGIMKALISK